MRYTSEIAKIGQEILFLYVNNKVNPALVLNYIQYIMDSFQISQAQRKHFQALGERFYKANNSTPAKIIAIPRAFLAWIFSPRKRLPISSDQM